MRDLIWLSIDQMALIEPYFPLSHGIALVDDREVLSGIIGFIPPYQAYQRRVFGLLLRNRRH